MPAAQNTDVGIVTDPNEKKMSLSYRITYRALRLIVAGPGFAVALRPASVYPAPKSEIPRNHAGFFPAAGRCGCLTGFP